jgi:hypothetical protein
MVGVAGAAVAGASAIVLAWCLTNGFGATGLGRCCLEEVAYGLGVAMLRRRANNGLAVAELPRSRLDGSSLAELAEFECLCVYVCMCVLC